MKEVLMFQAVDGSDIDWEDGKSPDELDALEDE